MAIASSRFNKIRVIVLPMVLAAKQALAKAIQSNGVETIARDSEGILEAFGVAPYTYVC
jgi:hypothetical protein